MPTQRLTRWLHSIYGTREQEISCTECLDQVSHVVDAELAGTQPAAENPEVAQHLSQCAACREEYETLRDLARFENEGGPPSVDELRDLIP